VAYIGTEVNCWTKLSISAGGVKKELRRLPTVGMPQDFESLGPCCQTTGPARFGRNWAFPRLASRESCEDCPVWGDFSKGHAQTSGFFFWISITS